MTHRLNSGPKFTSGEADHETTMNMNRDYRHYELRASVYGRAYNLLCYSPGHEMAKHASCNLGTTENGATVMRVVGDCNRNQGDAPRPLSEGHLTFWVPSTIRHQHIRPGRP